jgi:hypothetical protein
MTVRQQQRVRRPDSRFGEGDLVKHTAIRSAAVVDRSGNVLASAGPDEASWTESPGIARVPLPDGNFLATRADGGEAAWSSFARAFVHEARSPLNALVIYLELLSPRLPHAEGRSNVAPERVLAKAQEQVRRVEDLLRTFSELWAPRGNVADLAAIVRAATRFSEHQAIRKSLRFSQQVCKTAFVPVSPGVATDAVVALLSDALEARSESSMDVRLELVEGEPAVRFTVSLPVVAGEPAPGLFNTGTDAFRRCGASVVVTSSSATVTLPTCPPAEVA